MHPDVVTIPTWILKMAGVDRTMPHFALIAIVLSASGSFQFSASRSPFSRFSARVFSFYYSVVCSSKTPRYKSHYLYTITYIVGGETDRTTPHSAWSLFLGRFSVFSNNCFFSSRSPFSRFSVLLKPTEVQLLHLGRYIPIAVLLTVGADRTTPHSALITFGWSVFSFQLGALGVFTFFSFHTEAVFSCTLM